MLASEPQKRKKNPVVAELINLIEEDKVSENELEEIMVIIGLSLSLACGICVHYFLRILLFNWISFLIHCDAGKMCARPISEDSIDASRTYKDDEALKHFDPSSKLLLIKKHHSSIKVIKS